MATPTSETPWEFSTFTGVQNIDALLGGTQWQSTALTFSFPGRRRVLVDREQRRLWPDQRQRRALVGGLPAPGRQRHGSRAHLAAGLAGRVGPELHRVGRQQHDRRRPALRLHLGRRDGRRPGLCLLPRQRAGRRRRLVQHPRQFVHEPVGQGDVRVHHGGARDRPCARAQAPVRPQQPVAHAALPVARLALLHGDELLRRSGEQQLGLQLRADHADGARHPRAADPLRQEHQHQRRQHQLRLRVRRRLSPDDLGCGRHRHHHLPVHRGWRDRPERRRRWRLTAGQCAGRLRFARSGAVRAVQRLDRLRHGDRERRRRLGQRHADRQQRGEQPERQQRQRL